MKTAMFIAWSVTTFAVVLEQKDYGAAINVAAVAILGLIAWLIKKGIANFETRLDNIERRQSRAGRRLRIAELNIEAIAACHGIKPKRYRDDDEEEEFDDVDEE